jgi:hypothetical protein
MTRKIAYLSLAIVSATFIGCSSSEELTFEEWASNSGSSAQAETGEEQSFVTAAVIEEAVNASGDTLRNFVSHAFVSLSEYPSYDRIRSFNANREGIIEIPVDLLDYNGEYVFEVFDNNSGASGANWFEWTPDWEEIWMSQFMPIRIGQNIRITEQVGRSSEPQRIGDPRRIIVN